MKVFFTILSIGFLLINTAYTQNFEWAISYGGAEGDIAQAIGTDGSGNVYIAGYFRGTSDFDPGAGTVNLTSGTGNDDFFVQKLDPNGNLLWVKSWGNPSEIDVLYDLSIDPMGNVYTTGYFRGTVDFDPGSGVSNLSAVGNSDIFVSKLDASGNFVWAKSFGGSSSDRGYAIDTDANGNVYTTGYFISSADFDPGSGTHNISSSGLRDIFVQKLDASGNFVWATSFGGTSNDEGFDIAVDVNGNVHTTGYFRETVDFDPSAGVTNITSNGILDVFVHKLDVSGNFVWVKSFGSTSSEQGNAIAVDGAGNVFTTGEFTGTIDFDPGVGINDLTSAGSDDIFIQKLDNQGNFEWAYSFGNFSSDIGKAITTDQAGNVYTTGFFRHTVDFDPGSGVVNGDSPVGDDVFIQKLDGNGDFVWLQTFGADANDEPYAINIGPNSTVHSCGRFSGTGDFDPSTGTTTLTTVGVNDVYVQKLNQCTPNSGTDMVSACDTYNWIDGNTYTSSNSIATHTLTNVAGCDSVVSLNLTMSFSNTGDDIQTACSSFTWIDGNTYSSSTTSPTYILTNQAGCDSIVSLDLTINNVDVSVTDNSPVLTANTSSATNYQWIDCDNSNNPINGENSQSYTATINGSFAVVLTENGCVDTSSCINVNNVSLTENSANEFITISPNPNNGKFKVKSGLSINRIVILNSMGQLIFDKKMNGLFESDFILNEQKGIYFVKVYSKSSLDILRLIIK